MADRVLPVLEATVQILDKGKGKAREIYVAIKQASDAPIALELRDSKESARLRGRIGLRRAISEMKSPDVLYLITADQEVEMAFRSSAEAHAFHTFIVEKSEVHAENKAIAQLDDEMRLVWPFPGGSIC